MSQRAQHFVRKVRAHVCRKAPPRQALHFVRSVQNSGQMFPTRLELLNTLQDYPRPAAEVPCCDAGVDRRQQMTGSAKAMIE